MSEISVLLHNIRSAYNVGSIFRTADAAGVGKVFLSGYTPIPIDRFGRSQKEIAKTALGAEDLIAWEYLGSPIRVISRLKREKWNIVGVEQDIRARDYRSLKLQGSTLFVFGNEVRGLSRVLRDACDALVEIPMRGVMVRQVHHPRHTGRGKESLNVSVAAGVVLFQAKQNPGV